MNQRELALKEYIANWDPMGFIEELNAKSDEYDAEAHRILLLVSQAMSIEQVAQLIHQTFVEYMEIDPPGFAAQCLERAPEIRKILCE